MTTLCSHYPKEFNLEAFKAKISDKTAILNCESTLHSENPVIKQGSDLSQLSVCLHDSKVMCNRSTEGLCMQKYCTEHNYNLTVNLSSRRIWCYACDMDSVEISTFYQQDNDDCHTQEEFIKYREFVDKVILAIRESQGETEIANVE